MIAILRFLRPAHLPAVHALFDALIAHEDGGLPDPHAIGAIEAYDGQLARLPREDARAVRALLFLLEWAAPALLAGRARRFSRLALGDRRALLDRAARSRVGLLRTAAAALRKLALLAYYSRPATWPAIGYDGPWLGRVPVEVIAVPRPAGCEGPPPEGAP